MQRVRGLRTAVLGLVVTAVVFVAYMVLVTRPLIAVASAAPVPPASALVGDLDLPYMGLGVVWVRADGLVLIEISDKQTMAFQAQVSGMALHEKDGTVSFRTQPTPSGSLVHQFSDPPVAQPSLCSAAFQIVGYLEIDYDAETGQLEIEVDGAKQAFAAQFSFADAEVTSEGDGEPPAAQAGQGATCQCDCYGPSGGSCSASKSCDPGYTCSCKCKCLESSNSCTCSSCSRIRATGVVIVEVEPEPVDP